MNMIRLPGCHPEPLLSYLKALGVFRLVAEQADPAARAMWQDDVFVLQTALATNDLVAFFLSDYKPTPIIVSWSSAFFVEYAAGTESKARSRQQFTDAPTE